MKRLTILAFAAALCVSARAATAAIALGNAFTYQGQLKQGGAPLNSTADFEFRLWDDAGSGNPPTGGSQVGMTVSVNNVAVSNGLFTVGLDFGWEVFDGQARWLEVAVRVPHDPTGTAPYSTLAPRQEMSAVPYARFSVAPWATSGSNVTFTGGKVGIGTASPAEETHIEGNLLLDAYNSVGAGGGVFFRETFSPGGTGDPRNVAIRVRGLSSPDSPDGLELCAFDGIVFNTSYADRMVVHPNGNVGIGTTNPLEQLHVYEAGTGPTWRGRGVFSGQTSAAIIGEYDGKAVIGAHNAALNGWADLLINPHAGNVGIGLGSGTPQSKLDVGGAITIRGADVAEKFPVTGDAQPGMVMAIDPDNPGKLSLARGAYNRCVAGIVSGANGLSAGAILGNLPEDRDAPPIALSGRVWCYCDATTGPIAPGDLLTTSDTPGHAMKVADHARAQGAVLGKGMTPLKEGRGLVLVLVSLQ